VFVSQSSSCAISSFTFKPTLCCTVFIDPKKVIRTIITYPASTGRNVQELLRVIDSLQLSSQHKIATPVNWTPGDDVIIANSVKKDEADQLFPGYKSVKVSNPMSGLVGLDTS
jgi:alkyl hydroperoxide reductase subunit AhpC